MHRCALGVVSAVVCLGAAGAPARTADVPGFFVEDRQARGGARFVTHVPGMAAAFSMQEVLLKQAGSTVRVQFPGANPLAAPEPAQPLAGRANFLLGRDPAQWRTSLPVFGAVTYRDLYPGVDLIYSFAGRRLQPEFEVVPGADASVIRLRYPGNRARIAAGGALVLSGDGRELRDDPPRVYQRIAGRRVLLPGRFRVQRNGEVAFKAGGNGKPKPTPPVVDPLPTYSTYLGGNGQSSATGTAVDAAGNVYVAGWTDATNFPTASPMRSQNAGGVDAFIAKLGPGGNSLVYCTYLGGSGDDRAYALALDGSGNAYVTGWTGSSNFPTAAPLQSASAGLRDAFVVKLNPVGSALVYSTYLGGNANDGGYGIAVDSAGNAYVTGDTVSSNFPVLSAYQTSNRGQQNAFVAKLNPAGSALVYSTYLGGNGVDHAAAIALDASGRAYLTGSTTSTNFPTASALQTASGGGQDAFVTKLEASGNSLLYSTYLGGSGGTAGAPEAGQAIAVDAPGNAYVAGVTSSANFPVTSGAPQPAAAGGVMDAFVTKINASGSALVYSTYLGGSSIDCANAIAVDFVGSAYVAGYTGSVDFPSVRFWQGANAGLYDVFLAKIDPAGTALVFSTYLGGTGTDAANALAVDSLGNAYLAGLSLSSDFPLLNPIQPWNTSGYAAFITKMSPGWKAAVFNGGIWYIDANRNGSFDGTAAGDTILGFGQAGDIPVAGDWSGSGTVKIGVFRNGQWLLDYNGNGVWDGVAGGDRLYAFGQAGDLPVTGDWSGTGATKIGVYRAGFWMLDYNGNGVWDGQPADFSFWLGNAQYLPVVGDWNGSGTSKAGVFGGGWWYFDVDGDGQWTTGTDAVVFFGAAGDIPIAGDWRPVGLSNIGVFRSGLWVLDMNVNWQFDGIGVGEAAFWLGNSSYIPIVLH